MVLHTKLGEAAVLANIVDANKDEWILGTVAGANTLLVICRDQHVAKLMEDRFADLMKINKVLGELLSRLIFSKERRKWQQKSYHHATVCGY